MRESLRFVTRWIGGHPIAGFLLLTFGFSYVIGFPALIAYSAWAPPQPPVLRMYISRVLVVYGPGVAAILLSLLAQGLPGAIDLVSRLVPRRSDVPWAVAILLVGAVSSGLALTLSGVPFVQLTGAMRSSGVLFLTHFLLQILIVSIGEELGWRGWLLPRLLERQTRLRASLLVATAWGLWHGPLLLSGAQPTALFLLAVLGLSFLYTWIWTHAGERLFLVVLAHATVNAPIFFWEELAASRPNAGAGLSAWYAIEVMYGLAGCGLVLVTRKWWLQRPHGERTALQASSPP